MNKQKFSTNPMNFSDGLDIPDFDFDVKPEKDNRKPVDKVKAGLKKGFISSIASHSLDSVIKNALPRGYGDAYDLAVDINRGSRNAFNEAVKELRPNIKEMARAADKFIPENWKKTKGYLAAVDKWTSDNDYPSDNDSYKKSAEDYNIASELGNIFAFQEKQAIIRQADAQNIESVRTGLEMVRHKNQMGLLNQINLSTSRLAQYQDHVTAAYQKKSLELSYRKYFLMADILQQSKVDSTNVQKALGDIVKNTSLPDSVKLNNADRLKEKLYSSLLSSNSQIMGRIKENIGKTLKSYVSDASSAMQQATGMMEMVSFKKEMDQMNGEDTDTHSSAGSFVGGKIGDMLNNFVFDKLKTKSTGNKYINKYGKELGHKLATVPEQINEWILKNRKEEGWRGVGSDILSDITKGTRQDTEIKTDNLHNLQEPTQFNGIVKKSITEVIPGYLARIFREIQILRTGDDKIGLTAYDFTKSSFSSSINAKKSAADTFVDKNVQTGIDRDTDDIFKAVDPEGKLSPEARKAFIKKLLMDRLAGRLTDAEHYTNAGNLSDDFLKDHAKDISGAFSKHLESDTLDRTKKNISFFNEAKYMGERLRNPTKEIQALIDSGFQDHLTKAGIIDNRGINTDRLIDLYTGGSIADDEESAIPGNTTFGKRARQAKFKNATPTQITEPAGMPANALINTDSGEKIVSSIDSLKSTFEEKLNGIIKDSSNDKLDEINNTLKSIETIVATRPFGSGTSESNTPGENSDATNSWFKLTGRRIGQAGKPLLKGLWSVHKAGWSSLGFAGSATGKLIGKVVSTVAEARKRVGDLIVAGETIPRLTSVRMKAGQYANEKTGEIIKSIGDIRGNVIDIATGEVVLRSEELKDVYARIGLGGKLLNVGQSLVKDTFKIVTGINKIGNTFLGAAYGVAKGAASMVRDVFDGATDVYVKGDMTTPKLTASAMRAGLYTSRKTGKILVRSSEIDGPIETVKNGKPELVITEDDLRKGLVNSKGEPLRGIYEKIGYGAMKLVGGVFSGAKRLVTGAFKGLYKSMSALGTGAMGMLHAFAEGAGIGGWGKKNTEILEKIYNLLQNKLGKGSTSDAGTSEGSVTKRKSFKEKLKDKIKNVKDKVTGKGAATGLAAAGTTSTAAATGVAEAAAASAGSSSMIGAAAGVAGMAVAKTIGGGLLTAGGALLGGTGAVLGGVGTVLSGLGGIAGTLLSIVGAPVVLGTLATAAVLYGGYKAFQYLTNKTKDPVTQFRLAQYGFTSSDSNISTAVLGFEEMMEKLVVYKDGQATLDPKGFDMQEVFNIFGIDPKDDKQVQNWTAWFQGRFKPVFLTVLTALQADLGGGASSRTLSGIDDLTAKQKLKLMDLSSVDVYNNMTSPFPSISKLRFNASDVRGVYNFVAEDLKAKAEKEKDSGSESGSMSKEVAGAAATGIAASTDSKDEAKETAISKSFSDKIGDYASKSLKGMAGMLAAGATAVFNAAKWLGEATGITVAGKAIAKNLGYGITVLESVRFRAYGLKEMDASKVNALRKLEEIVYPNTLMLGGTTPQWTGSLDKTFSEVKNNFGIYIAGDMTSIWAKWFGERFLPAYLAFRAGMFEKTGNLTIKDGAEDRLKPSDIAYVASKIAADAAWSKSSSPWPDYVLCTDAANIAGIMDEIKSKDKETTLPEKVNANKPVVAPVSAVTGTPAPSNEPIANTMDRDIIKTSLKSSDGTAVRSSDGMVVDTPNSTYNDYNSPSSAPTGTNLPGANGAYTAIADPKGGGYSGLKDMITSAAKAVGIGPNLVSGIIGMESNFDPNAKAKTSSASGLGQFIKSTWNEMIRKHGPKFGLDASASPFDPKANAIMTAQFTKDNADILKSVKKDVSVTDLYLAHFLGAGGAKKFLSAGQDAIAAQLMPDAAKANASIFYEGNRPRTTGEIYNLFKGRINKHLSRLGVSVDSNDAGMPSVASGSIPASGAVDTGSIMAMPDGVKSTSAVQANMASNKGVYVPAKAIVSNSFSNYSSSDTMPELPAAKPTNALASVTSMQATPSYIPSAQRQEQSGESVTIMTSIKDTLIQSLGIHRESNTTLQSLLREVIALANNASGKDNSSVTNVKERPINDVPAFSIDTRRTV